MTFLLHCCFVVTSLVLILTSLSAYAATNDLPNIGNGATIGTVADEKRLGHAWLRLYRRQVPINSDPQLIEYSEALLEKIAQHNPDAGNNLSLVIVNNSTLNAFAVPGGVIGIHTGLFQHALTEGQFASVIAHELAHLSQRHYARRVEKQKSQQIIGMAALLASLVIAATSSGEAGAAAVQTTQAGLIDAQLRFSRNFEQEADRVGMTTLVNAGFDPHAMAEMFEQMQRASRFSTEPPEFLLTHPVTAKRIADAENRARKHKSTFSASSMEYDLMRSRVLFLQEETALDAINRFDSELRGFSPSKIASRYGLVLALTADKQYEKADAQLQTLLALQPQQTAFIIAKADIEAGQNKLPEAIDIIRLALKDQPNSYALNTHLSRLLTTQTQYAAAAKILSTLKEQRPEDPFIWYHLAEIAGLSGDILTLHKARTEYFILYGNFDNAENQLNNIIKKYPKQPEEIRYAEMRLKAIKALRKESKL